MPTGISWTDETWNPVTGCSHVSEGCRNCYAEALAKRFKTTSHPWIAQFASENVKVHFSRLIKVQKFRSGQRIFVNSMSDLFHPLVPDSFICEVWDQMISRPDLTFQILTKRPERAAQWFGPWESHIWLGTSIENADVMHRLDLIKESDALQRFISFEPLLGPIPDVDLSGIHWAIVGGESGPKHRHMQMEWARAVRDLCVSQDVAFFFKQDCGFRTEMHPYLTEKNGECVHWQSFPDSSSSPALHHLQTSHDQANTAYHICARQRQPILLPLA